MQNVKKYFTEGLIQFTILLSLIGGRVDVDSYFNSYFSPLLEINVGPSSAYVQTPFHSLRDTWDGYSVHPKCPELDYFFASRRLLEEVRALGSPRFPTQLSAWLVHQVPESSGFGEPSNDSTSSGNHGTGLPLPSASPGDEADRQEEQWPTAAQQQPGEPGPYLGAGACDVPKEEAEVVNPAPSTRDQSEGEDDDDDGGDEGRGESTCLTQLAHSSTLEQEGLLGSGAALPSSSLSGPPSTIDIDQHWSHFMSLPVSDFDDLDPLVPQRLSDMDPGASSAISQDVSLRDAVVTGSGAFHMVSQRGEARSAAQQRGPLFRLESTNSSHSDSPPGAMTGLAALPFAAVSNGTRNATSHNVLGGSLDEAVFDHINLLGWEGLEPIAPGLMEGLEGPDAQAPEELDSDSGLSLESSSQGPASPGSSDVSSSSGSFCEDEGGATGYSSEVDSLPSKGISDFATTWSPVDLSESVWHDHSYASPDFSETLATLSHKTIKQEPLSEEDEEEEDEGEDEDEEQELSRDELRARALHIPFSAPEIVSMPVEGFLELLEGHGLSPAQVGLLRDIRRRGKNKLAAQNCRKRKLDVITGLQGEVERLQAQRERLLRERQHTAKALGAAGQQVDRLSRDVLARLRDSSGRPLTPERYTLQCGANGRVVVQPLRRSAVATAAGGKADKRKKEKKP